MGRSSKVIATGAVALVGAQLLRQQEAFVPAPARAAPAAAAAAAAGFAPAAFAVQVGSAPEQADQIGVAAQKLGDASYAFAKEVDWNSALFLQAPGAFKPLEALKAIDAMIVMGAQADAQALKNAAYAHHRAIKNVDSNGVTTKNDWDQINAGIGRIVASVPEKTVMDVYTKVSAITDPGVPAFMKSKVNAADAERAYQGFLDFKDVVKENQVKVVGPTSQAYQKGEPIGIAAKKLSQASYPFLKEVDWLSDIYIKPLPGVTPKMALKAVDKTIVMGSMMDKNALKAGAEAHHKAIGSIDAKGVTSAVDYEAVNAAIGRMVASVPTSVVMDVYNAWAGILSPSVPNKMFSGVNPLDANAAAKAFYEFKDVVKAAQR